MAARKSRQQTFKIVKRFNNRSRSQVGRFRRRNGLRPQRFSTISGQMGNSSNLSFAKRKSSFRTWNKRVLATTDFKSHYRSILSGTTFPITPSTADQALTLVSIPLPAALPFWLAGNGAQPIDTGVPVPIFNTDNIIIRGGVTKITLTNRGANSPGLTSTDPVRLKIWGCWSKTGSNLFLFNALTVPAAWDPTCVPEFNNHIKILSYRETFLLDNRSPFEMTYRIKPHKVDLTNFNSDDQKFFWIVSLAEAAQRDLLGTDVMFQVQWNISFSADPQ